MNTSHTPELLEVLEGLLVALDTCRQIGKLKGGELGAEVSARAAIGKATMNLPTRKEWEAQGFMVSDELCSDNVQVKSRAELAKLKADRADLLEALEQCVRRLDKLNTGGPSEPDPTVVKARAAIAKAQGL